MAFYDLFSKSAYHSALAIVGNSEEAEEIMQDTLIKVFSKTELLHNDADAMTRILKRIATNNAIDVVRKRKDIFESIEDNAITDYEDEDEPDEEDLTVDDIKEGIANLSPGYRSIISLRLFEDMSFAEISESLEINASTVRVQYTRGIAKLRIYLNEKVRKDEQYA
jgi:RNA polymerase sigma-70 factor (ECF subfamily)